MPVTSCEATTKYFFDLNISSTGLQRGFSVHGIMIRDVQKVICVSEIPIFLYISTDAWAIATKGSPMAKYADGTHNSGLISLDLVSVIFLFIISLRMDFSRKRM